MSQPESKPHAASKARDPPPSLFLHPQQHGASHVSLPGMLAAGAAVPSASSTTTNNPQTLASTTSTRAAVPPSLTRQESLLNPRGRNIGPGSLPRLQTADSSRTADRTDALWAEMQATLEEVELSASGGTHVFGPEHDRKLAELRAAQIALAQAWARSEADDAIETTAGAGGEEVRDLKSALGHVGLTAVAGMGPGMAGKATGDGTEHGKSIAGRSTAGTGSARPGSSGGERLGAALEEETEVDILLARKRREANDRYFSRVDRGVRDVVSKLEAVAVAMKQVEQESREIWGEESMSGGDKA